MSHDMSSVRHNVSCHVVCLDINYTGSRWFNHTAVCGPVIYCVTYCNRGTKITHNYTHSQTYIMLYVYAWAPAETFARRGKPPTPPPSLIKRKWPLHRGKKAT